jgi:hypothetical protein
VLRMRNQVFISYRHESTEHKEAVRRLGTLLSQAKIPVQLDQFFLENNPGGPDEGWPKWCEDSAIESKCVLIIASEGWFAAYDKIGEPASGFGAASEADLFRQAFWDNKGNNARVRVAYLHEFPVDKVPVRLRAWHTFQPFADPGQLAQLIRWITGCLELEEIAFRPVRWPTPVAFEPDLADRIDKEWPAIVDLLAGRSRERILLFEGGSGLGKSELLRHAKVYARMLGLPVCHVDFKGGSSNTETVLESLALDLGDHLPNFSRESPKSFPLRKDLRALRQPILLIFDTYEGVAGNKPLTDWLTLELLADVENSPSLAVILAGQKVPDPALARWRELAHHFALGAIREFDAWDQWVSRRFPDFSNKGDLRTLLKATDGSPLLMATLCANVAKG